MTSTAKQSDATADALGKEGAPCSECGTPLAADQRYCLNCGHRRGEPRVEFERHLFTGDGAAKGPAAAASATPPASRAWNPLVAVGLIALLAIMLLVGVLIGMEDNDDEQSTTGTAPAPSATPTTPAPGAAPPATPPPATTTPAPPPTGSPPATPGAGAGGGAGGGLAPGVGAPESEAPTNPGGSR